MAAIVKWTDGALADIDAIAAYIAQDSEQQPRLQVQPFFERAAVLERYPHAGHIVREADNSEIREILVNSYRIIYRILSPELLHVLTVYHSKRLLSGEEVSAM